MEIEVRHFFDASHQLPDSEHLVTKACARLHGHTYAVVVTADTRTLEGGMVVDFKAIKNAIDVLDHWHINEVFKLYPRWEHCEPTSENIAKFIHAQIESDCPRLQHVKVAVCEGYKGPERANWTTYA